LLARLAHAARAVLLAVALLAAATAWLFAARPEWIDAIDDSVVAAATRDAEAALARASVRGLGRGGVEAELLPLLARLQGTRKGDRLSAFKRTALARLAAVRLAAGDATAALAATDAWRAFDPLDLEAKLAAQRALAVKVGCEPPAAALALELFATAPDVDRFCAPHLEGCLARGDEGAAAAAFFTHLRAGGTPASSPIDAGWVLLRDDGDGFDPVRREPLEVRCEDGELRVAFTPAHDCKRLRLSLPPRVSARLLHARFRIATSEQAAEVPLRELARQTGAAVGEDGLRYEDDAVVLCGHDEPFLLWSLGPGARVATTWTLCASVEPITAPWLGPVLALTLTGTFGRALLAGTAVEDARARQRYQACRRVVLEAGEVGLRLDERDLAPVPLVRRTDGSVGFTTTLVRGEATHLKLRLPPVAGIELTLRGPFPAAERLVVAEGVEVDGAVVRAARASTVLAFALRDVDGDRLALEGSLQ